MITEEIKQKIKNHAIQEAPNECCGLLILNDNRLSAFGCVNSAKNKKDEFSINPKDYLRGSIKGKIVGIYHSHGIQETSFSELDKQISHQLNLKNIVYIVKKDQFEEYSPENYYNKYTNRDFKINVSDCLTVVEDYYREEFGINVFHYNRPEGWDHDYGNFIRNILKFAGITENFDDLIKREGFIKNSEPRKHDLVMFKYFENYPSHFGIYLENDYILHQPRNKKSIIEKLSKPEKRRIYCYGRHKLLA